MDGGDVVEARERVIESLEQSAEVYGLSRSAGRIYGVLYFAEKPLSIPALVEETKYAKSTVSTVTRTLTRIGLVHRRSSKGGGRRIRFEAEREVWVILQEVFQQYVHREIQATLRTIRRAEEQLPDADSHEQERLRDIGETYDDFGEIVQLASEYSTGELREALETYEPARGQSSL